MGFQPLRPCLIASKMLRLEVISIRKRNIRIQFRLTEKENIKFQKQLELSGLSAEKFIRDILEGVEIKEHPPDNYYEVLRLIANISNNINQIAHVVNATGNIHHEQVSALTFLTDKCWNRINELR